MPAPTIPTLRSPGGGDNLFLASIVALDADTGKYVWHYQVNPREAWDYKATADMITATLTIDGKPRKVLMQAPTNGFFYVLDRETGKLISAEKIGKVTWAERIDLKTGRPVEAPNIRYETGDPIMLCPGTIGAHNWQAMSYSPQTGLVYIPYMQIGMRLHGQPLPGDFRVGGIDWLESIRASPTTAKARWSPGTRSRRSSAGRTAHDTIWNGGTLSTGGGLVFQGTADG